MKKNVTFLTKRNFDVKLLINNLKKDSSSVIDVKDQQILKEVIGLLEKDETSFLSPQETHFLDSNDKKIWAEYLIFRYKMKYFPRKQIVYDFPIYLLIEPVSACNLRCIMCFQIDESFTSNNNFMGNMDIDLFKKIIDEAVEGGTKRQDSSLNGVLATNIESENILIHDAVRPFVTARVISDCLNSLEKAHVSVPIMDSTNSLIELNNKQVSFVDRNHIKTVQTPQCFKRALILEVLNSSIDGTDEVGMLLKYNPEKKIEFVKGDSSNLKITSPIDLIIASSLLEAK